MADHLTTILSATLDPVRTYLAQVEEQIALKEAELKQLRDGRARAKKVLAIVDPQAPKKERQTGTGTKPVSDAQVEKIYGHLLAFNGNTFDAKAVSEDSGIHVTSIHKALKVLHDRGQVRLDHMGGARHTSRFYALTGGTDE